MEEEFGNLYYSIYLRFTSCEEQPQFLSITPIIMEKQMLHDHRDIFHVMFNFPVFVFPTSRILFITCRNINH